MRLAIVSECAPDGVNVGAWIDSGFTGELVFPKDIITQLELVKGGSVDAILADGSPTELDTLNCKILWFEREKHLEVIANDGETPLLGVGLLLSRSMSRLWPHPGKLCRGLADPQKTWISGCSVSTVKSREALRRLRRWASMADTLVRPWLRGLFVSANHRPGGATSS